MATIIVFALSLTLSLLLLLLKSIELKSGNKNYLLNLIGSFENSAEKLIQLTKFRGLQFLTTIRYIVSVRAKEVVRDILEKIKLAIMQEYEKRQVVLMGRKNIVNRGSVSFYLKKIAENKKESGQGKIEDIMPE